MSNQNADLKQKLKQFVDDVAVKKGRQWAMETQAEFQASERLIIGASVNQFIKGDHDGATRSWGGNVSGDWSAEAPNYYDFSKSGKKRITPHDTGNLIAAISMMVTKNGNERYYSVGIDYGKLNNPRYMYSWYLDRTGHPDRWVKRPGKNKSAEYVEAANANSDERPDFLIVWGQRGEDNIRRIFR